MIPEEPGGKLIFKRIQAGSGGKTLLIDEKHKPTLFVRLDEGRFSFAENKIAIFPKNFFVILFCTIRFAIMEKRDLSKRKNASTIFLEKKAKTFTKE